MIFDFPVAPGGNVKKLPQKQNYYHDFRFLTRKGCSERYLNLQKNAISEVYKCSLKRIIMKVLVFFTIFDALNL